MLRLGFIVYNFLLLIASVVTTTVVAVVTTTASSSTACPVWDILITEKKHLNYCSFSVLFHFNIKV